MNRKGGMGQQQLYGSKKSVNQLLPRQNTLFDYSYQKQSLHQTTSIVERRLEFNENRLSRTQQLDEQRFNLSYGMHSSRETNRRSVNQMIQRGSQLKVVFDKRASGQQLSLG